jgi:hypothetical protein
VFILRKTGRRWLATLFLASPVREVMATWLLALIMLAALVVLPSKDDERDAPSWSVTGRPLTHREMQQSATKAMLPCEDEADDEMADDEIVENEGNPVIVHAPTRPAPDFEEC